MAYTEYFEEPGPVNTERTLAIAAKRAAELGIKKILVASTRGDTGVKASEVLKGFQVIVVTHSTGFRTLNEQELTEENHQKILANGATILTCTHAFGGIGRAVRRKLATYELEELIAYTLRIFGEATKVACEMTMMATDAGLIRTDEEVITISGTSRGADTALVMKPANAQDFFNLRVKEILCKPRF